MSERDTTREMVRLSADECWDLLATSGIGRLAVSIMNRPDVFPVNYVVDDRSILVRTGPGVKLAAAVLGTAVAFEVDVTDAERRTAWSVVVKGRATEVSGVEDLLDADDLDLEPWTGRDGKTRLVRLHPEEVTGRRIVPTHDREER